MLKLLTTCKKGKMLKIALQIRLGFDEDEERESRLKIFGFGNS